ncbi:uncharacterized protein LOC143178220 [Calliopsis andreniformis]|uniref:uncharacterized protein LOC143178220 n=1 Tax=Calliopsis andreniformis TaxID=337506 RepID=UPI003FCD736F
METRRAPGLTETSEPLPEGPPAASVPTVSPNCRSRSDPALRESRARNPLAPLVSHLSSVAPNPPAPKSAEKPQQVSSIRARTRGERVTLRQECWAGREQRVSSRLYFHSVFVDRSGSAEEAGEGEGRRGAKRNAATSLSASGPGLTDLEG